MEREKRKIGGGGGSLAPRKRARMKEGSAAAAADGQMQPPSEVGDEEVEEFFAILKRIRAVVKYFGKGDGESGSGRKMTTEVLERECSAEINGGDAAVEKKETAIKKLGVIDLNMVPNPDDNSG
nr:protein NIM1-INTERACTING 2 [Ipomoea batatas]